MKRPAGGVLAAGLVLLLLAAGIAWFLWERCGLRGCPDIELLNGYVPDEASIVVDRRGVEVAKLYRVRRVVVPLDSLPPYVPAAFIAIEDRRFWSHDGVDWRRVLGAAWANLRAMGIEEGFSTITMQLARSIFPDRLPVHERTLSRKLAEVRVAREIEDRYSKRQILEMYLNQIYFGGGAWGIEAAAHEYFGKPAAALTLAEAALLAGLIRAPNRLNPRVAPEAALARRRVVLNRMAAQGLITPAEAAVAAAEPLELSRGETERSGRAPYYVEEARRALEERFGDAIYTSGYRIHTALDLEVQRIAETELRRQLEAIEAGHYGRLLGPGRDGGAGAADRRTTYLQGAVVVMDARTGDVLALVGGRDFADSKFNRATQARRQPGSAFKPFVYVAALAAGLPPTHALSDTPLHRVLEDGTVWSPQNYEGGYAGVVTLRDALVQSRNVATIRLAEEVGLDAVIDIARRFGLSGPIPRVPSVAIGAAEVTLLELTAAYAAFATLGRRPEPRLVLRVEDRNGRVIWERAPRGSRVLDPATAFLITNLLSDVVDRGTGTAVRAVGFRGPAAGKTGTTNDATDTWFLGYTPHWAAGVWIGFDRPHPIVGGATGGRLAAPVWGRIMRQAAPPSREGWSPPPGVETRLVDASGGVLAPWCAPVGPVREEYFLAGTAPYATCGPTLSPLWPDSIDPGLLGTPADSGEERWWNRLRRRLFGPPAADSAAGHRPDPSPRPAPPDTAVGAEPGRPDPSEPAPSEPAPSEPGGERPPRILGRPAPPEALRPRPARPDSTG